MKIRIHKTYLIFFIFFVTILLIYIIYKNNDRFSNLFKSMENIRNNTIYSNNNNISFINFEEYQKQNINKLDYYLNIGDFEIEFLGSKEINIINSSFNEYEWSVPFMNYYEGNQKPSAFIDQWLDKLLIISGRGDTNFINLSNLEEAIQNSDNLIMNKISNNLSELISDKNFFGRGWISVKDIMVDDNQIYLSYTNLLKINDKSNTLEINNPESDKIIDSDDLCYGLSILRADLNIKFLEFKEFMTLEECVNTSTPEFTAHLVGGRMINYNDHILISTGDFRTRYLSQDDNSYLGKILILQKDNKKIEIFSKGHRNPQGLFFDKENNIILSTEHGPWGGDEINLIYKNNNYGWPISSYGKHYCEKKQPMTEGCKAKYDLYPLHKSHTKHNFIEPIKYFNKSLGISEIAKLSKKFSSEDTNNYIVSSLGGEIGRQFYIFKISDKKNPIITDEYFISSGERVRDLKISTNGKYIFSFKEDTSVLSIIF